VIHTLRAGFIVLFCIMLAGGPALAETPGDEVKQTLNKLVQLLEQDKLDEFVKLSTPPKMLASATPKQLKEFMAQFAKDKARILNMLKQTQSMEMRLLKNNTLAKFGKEGGLDHEISFQKIDGKWYLR
jgi:uncharacterized protein YjgD (DUF1641 family)